MGKRVISTTVSQSHKVQFPNGDMLLFKLDHHEKTESREIDW